MITNLTVIKHNHPKSKYPTHDSGIIWQPWVHLPVTPQGRLQKIPLVYSIHSSGNLSAILRTGGGESGGGLQLGIRSKCSKTLCCSTLGCLRCNSGGQLSNQLTAAIGNKAKMRWSCSFLAARRTALSLLLCLFCLVGGSGFLSFVKYCQMGNVLFAASFFALFSLVQIPTLQQRTHCCFFFNVCKSLWSSVIGKYLSHS